jgi:hypothetical protein
MKKKNESGAHSSVSTNGRQVEKVLSVETSTVPGSPSQPNNDAYGLEWRRNYLLEEIRHCKQMLQWGKKMIPTKDNYEVLSRRAGRFFDHRRLKCARQTLSSTDLISAFEIHYRRFQIEVWRREQFNIFNPLLSVAFDGYPSRWFREWQEYQLDILPGWLKRKRAQEGMRNKAAAKAALKSRAGRGR